MLKVGIDRSSFNRRLWQQTPEYTARLRRHLVKLDPVIGKSLLTGGCRLLVSLLIISSHAIFKPNVYLTCILMLCVVLGGLTSWTATELARRAEPEARIRVLLELGRIPKSFSVVPQAVKFWRESRGAGMNGTENQEPESEQLDFLNFLSEKRGRVELFKLVTADGNALTLVNWILGWQIPNILSLFFWWRFRFKLCYIH